MRTFTGWVYTAFVLNVFSRRIVGWQVVTSLYTELALDALDMGTWSRAKNGADLNELVHHSDQLNPPVSRDSLRRAPRDRGRRRLCRFQGR